MAQCCSVSSVLGWKALALGLSSVMQIAALCIPHWLVLKTSTSAQDTQSLPSTFRFSRGVVTALVHAHSVLNLYRTV